MRIMHPPVYSMKDVMVDIETLGTMPGSAILSIGAVAFDAETGEFGASLLAQINPIFAVNAGLTVDPKTMVWWMQQGDEARSEAFGGALDLLSALTYFSTFIGTEQPLRLWAKPPSFDLVLLEAAYAVARQEVPWHYRSPRCVRTIMDVAGLEYGHTLPAHTALDDAKAQAGIVIESYAKIRQSAAAGSN